MKQIVLASIFIIAFSSATYAQVNISDLTPEQQNLVKQLFANSKCTCGCDLTIATCLADDPTCETSPQLARAIVEEVKRAKPKIELKRVDISHLSYEQQTKVYEIVSVNKCACGCGLTIIKCLADDPTCETSPKLAKKVMEEVVKATPKIDLKRVDISHLSGEQQLAVYNTLSSNTCTCGCGMTIAKCLVEDPTCEVSSKLAMAVIANVASAASSATSVPTGPKGLKSDGGEWYKEVVGRQLLYIYVGNGYRKKEKIWLCSDGTFQSTSYGGSISSLGSAAFSDGGYNGNWAVNGDILTLAFANGSTAKYKLSWYDGFLYLDNTRYFRVENDVCK